MMLDDAVVGRFTIRTMVRHDLDHAFKLSVEEGWNIGVFDHETFYRTDPQGFFIGEWEGRPVGSVSAVAYGPGFGFMGIYILAPEFRNRGFGIQLFREGLSHLGDRNIGLDSVTEQQSNYEKSGFKAAYRNVRYAGIGGGTMPEGLVELSELTFQEVADFDRRHFPAPRVEFLSGFLQQPQSVTLCFVKAGKLVGYGMIRRFVRGWSIAPLFADNPEIAETLLAGLSATQPGEPIFLDVPEVNAEAIALAKRFGMNPAFETVRMYTQAAPLLPLGCIYGVTSFELG